MVLRSRNEMTLAALYRNSIVNHNRLLENNFHRISQSIVSSEWSTIIQKKIPYHPINMNDLPIQMRKINARLRYRISRYVFHRIAGARQSLLRQSWHCLPALINADGRVRLCDTGSPPIFMTRSYTSLVCPRLVDSSPLPSKWETQFRRSTHTW